MSFIYTFLREIEYPGSDVCGLADFYDQGLHYNPLVLQFLEPSRRILSRRPEGTENEPRLVHYLPLASFLSIPILVSFFLSFTDYFVVLKSFDSFSEKLSGFFTYTVVFYVVLMAYIFPSVLVGQYLATYYNKLDVYGRGRLGQLYSDIRTPLIGVFFVFLILIIFRNELTIYPLFGQFLVILFGFIFEFPNRKKRKKFFDLVERNESFLKENKLLQWNENRLIDLGHDVFIIRERRPWLVEKDRILFEDILPSSNGPFYLPTSMKTVKHKSLYIIHDNGLFISYSGISAV
jgi:hypothetical protein